MKYMGKQIHIVILSLCLVIFVACDTGITPRQINRFYNSTIVFPDSLEFFFNGVSSFVRIDNESVHTKRQVIFIDSLECSLCRVQKSLQYEDLFMESLEKRKFDLIIIISPPRMERSTVRAFLLNRDLKVPIYLDSNNSFYSINPPLHSSRLFHAFLLDNSDHPIYVGDPSRDGKLYELFEHIINN